MQTQLLNTEKELKISNLEKKILELENEIKNTKNRYEEEIQTIS